MPPKSSRSTTRTISSHSMPASLPFSMRSDPRLGRAAGRGPHRARPRSDEGIEIDPSARPPCARSDRTAADPSSTHERVPHDNEDDCADDGHDDRRDVHAGDVVAAEDHAGEEPTDQRADDAEDDVTDDAEAFVTAHEQAGEPAGDCADDQPG